MKNIGKARLHNTPIDKQHNLLDRFSNVDKFRYYGANFLSVEKSLVKKKITSHIRHGKILNVGCGRNGTERKFFPASKYEIYGLDISEESLFILKGEKLYDGLLRGHICLLPFASESFDIIYLRLILHHLVYPKDLLDAGLSECFRVLKTGGILALVEPNRWHPIGAIMNTAHKFGVDLFIHGTNDDVALSPFLLKNKLSCYGDKISTHVVTYNWRRLPIPVQSLINNFHVLLKKFSNRVPYFGHTLMMIAVKS